MKGQLTKYKFCFIKTLNLLITLNKCQSQIMNYLVQLLCLQLTIFVIFKL